MTYLEAAEHAESAGKAAKAAKAHSDNHRDRKLAEAVQELSLAVQVLAEAMHRAN
ncbi:hypothetical protein LJR042_003546 [Microbacterium maritypicum]|uniref:hypothetical protein n=1 Tax=Microbacterium TaxID=33882 RepID=UPI002AFE2022|nr:hypothetical protein [Microbacterium sp. STF-2]MEA1264242.1 hypothetical protein [Microbacterium sp. STF-2]